MDTRLDRYSVGRFLICVAVLAGTLLLDTMRGGEDEEGALIRYVSASSLVLVTVATAVLRRWRSPAMLYAQFVVDLAIATALCAITGGSQSPFTLFFFPAIASAAYLLGLPGSMVTATMATALLTGLTVVPGFDRDPATRLGVYYEFMFRVFAFYLIGGLTGLLAESANRTERELTEARRSSQLLASEHQMVLDTIRAGVLISGRDRRIQGINPAARELVGEVAGRSVAEVLPGMASASTTDHAWEELRPGGQRWICSMAEMTDGGVVVVVEDVTELLGMREREARDDRLVGVGRLAASVAHEIRNPLASLSGALQLIAEDRPSRLATLALAEAERLNRLVENFLSSASPPPLSLARVDLQEVARLVAESFRADPRYRGKVDIDVVGGPLAVRVDPDRMRQVLWNLVLNGAQAMPRGGTVRVAVTPTTGEPPQAEVTIADTGEGVAVGDRHRMFDPFFTTRSGGSGLGLAVVDQIVRAHGGEIQASWPPSGGTTFRILLPMEGPRGG